MSHAEACPRDPAQALGAVGQCRGLCRRRPLPRGEVNSPSIKACPALSYVRLLCMQLTKQPTNQPTNRLTLTRIRTRTPSGAARLRDGAGPGPARGAAVEVRGAADDVRAGAQRRGGECFTKLPEALVMGGNTDANEMCLSSSRLGGLVLKGAAVRVVKSAASLQRLKGCE
jgi:hypothetical protein